MKIVIRREEDDPMGILRASIGGTYNMGFYLTYRGDLEEVETMIREILLELAKHPKPPKPGRCARCNDYTVKAGDLYCPTCEKALLVEKPTAEFG